MFYKKGVLGNFAKFTGKHLLQNLFFTESLVQVFSSESCEHLFFHRTPPVDATVKACNFTEIRLCHECFFVNFLKIFRTFFFFLMCCKNFLKIHKNSGEKMFAKYLSADGCFVKTIILLTVMITTMLSVS